MALSDEEAYEACLAGNLKLVLAWIKQLPDESLDENINLKFTYLQNTLLHTACGRGNLSLVNQLLVSGASTNSENRYRKTPLHIAAGIGDGDIVRKLIKAGASVDKTDIIGNNALFYAGENGDKDTVTTLLAYGATLIENMDGETAVCVACQRGHVSIIHCLLKSKGKDYSEEVIRRLSSAFRRKTVTHTRIADVLLQSIPLYAPRFDAFFNVFDTLYTAGDMQAVNTIFSLLERDKSLIPGGTTYLLYRACRDGRIDLLDIILSCGLKINYVQWASKGILHYAIIDKNVRMVKALIERGADVNRREENTLLHQGVMADFHEVLPILLEAGADINAKTVPGGQTALHLACKHSNLSAVKLLLQYNPNVNIRNKSNETPLKLAQAFENREIVDAIQKHICKRERDSK